MWVILAFLSALMAGLTTILAKCGIRDTDSDVATALRTGVVLVFSWLMALLAGSTKTLSSISARALVFLILSGCSTGLSWLCYYRALQMGDVNKVTPIDKSSTVLTMLLGMIFLGEGVTLLKTGCMLAIGSGTLMMLERKQSDGRSSRGWLLYALGSAVFASLTAILGKIGIESVESNLGTAIRTGVVLLLSWGIVFSRGKQRSISSISRKSWLFLMLSGLATGLSWLCYYRALQTGPASVVAPIDKLSILVTMAFSYWVLKERMTRRSLIGLALMTAGTLALLL